MSSVHPSGVNPIEALARLISVPSVSALPGDNSAREILDDAREAIRDLFPTIWSAATVVRDETGGVLLRWGGNGATEGPRGGLLLAAHYDVVPAGPGWSVAPFGGEVRDGYVWGRGAIDDKGSLVAILTAAENLAREGWRPSQPIWFAFGGDEEIGGRDGAGANAAILASAQEQPAWVLDEGAAVVHGMVPGASGPVALIGCAEKGHITIRLTARAAGGHASNPPYPDAGALLAQALRRVTRRRLPVTVPRATVAFVRALGATMGGLAGAVLRGYPLTAPLVHRTLARVPQTDAMIRSTLAVTMLEGSEAPNVLPGAATALINSRTMPTDTMERVVAEIRRRVGALPVEVSLGEGWDNNDAPPESPPSGPGWEMLVSAVRRAFPTVPVLPYLVTAATDSRHYHAVTDATYRFAPIILGAEDLAGVHGPDERVSVENLTRAVAVYREVMVAAGAEQP